MVYFYDAWAVGVHPFGKTQPSFHLFLIVSIFEVPSLCSIIFFPGAPSSLNCRGTALISLHGRRWR